MSKNQGTAIHWFRRDLRLEDNPALSEACTYEHVIPVYIWDPDASWQSPLGGASKWWLEQSLLALAAHLQKQNRDLIVRIGQPAVVLKELIQSTQAKAVFWNRLYEPQTLTHDEKLERELRTLTKRVETFNSYLLLEANQVLKKDGEPYLVYTAFFNAASKLLQSKDLFAKVKLPPLPSVKFSSVSIDKLQLVPVKSWTQGLAKVWIPGETQAQKILKNFFAKHVQAYETQRNFPAEEGTSRLSPYLHFGEISVASILQKLHESFGARSRQCVFLKELFWRDFSHHLLLHFPRIEREPLRTQFAKFPWEENEDLFKAWTEGRTGYPIVDAGMRQLWQTGWMHNRVRMIVASFLVKDLLIPWQRGAAWFWDTLLDANLANNTQNWQWVAGCGADAAPYFRIFNPTLQGEKFDPEGQYVKTWCPELEKLPSKWIHKPWLAPQKTLLEADVLLGKTYSKPIVDHERARFKALLAYDRIKKKSV